MQGMHTDGFCRQKAQIKTQKKAILCCQNIYSWHALPVQFRNTYTATILDNLLTRCRKGCNTIVSMHFLHYYAEAEVHAYIFKTSYTADCQQFTL